jgi:hypothetical protein
MARPDLPMVRRHFPALLGLVIAATFSPCAANALDQYEMIYANKVIGAGVEACLSKKFERKGKSDYTKKQLSTLKFFSEKYNATLGVKTFDAIRDFYHLEASSNSGLSPLIVTILSVRRPLNVKVPETENNNLYSKAPMKYEARVSKRFILFAQTESRSINNDDRNNFSYIANCFEADAP